MDSSLLSEATSSDDSPTPGYMLSEIARATIASYQACTQLEDFLLSRLTKTNHNIKYKCLLIIKHVCRSGRPEFKRDMGRNTGPIKDCLQFKGPPDPLRGDEIYRRVREAAKEAMDAIFDSQAPVITSAVAAANRIQGMGGGSASDMNSRPKVGSYVNSGDYSSGQDTGYAGHPGASGSLDINQFPNSRNYNNQTGTYSPGGSRMQGFGNPNFAEKNPPSSGLASAATSLAQSAASMLVAAAGDLAGRVNSGSFQSGNNSGDYTTQYVPQTSNPGYMQQQQNVWGANAVRAPQGGTVVPNIPVQPSGLGRAGGAAADGGYESQMLETLCDAGGLKTTLNEDQLKSFLNVAPTLNPDIIGASLIGLLNHDAWQTRSKALMVIASLVQHKDCDAHFEFWQTNSDEISGLLSDPKTSVRTQALKALQAAQVEVDAETIKRAGVTTQPTKTAHTSASAGVASQLSLLDLADSPKSAPPAAPSVAATTKVDLFDGMSAPATPSGSVLSAGSANSGAAAYQQPAPARAPTSTASPFDLLGDDFSGGAAAPAQPAPAVYDPFATTATPPVVAAPAAYDLSFLGAAPTPAPSAAPQNRVDLNSLLSAAPAPTTMPQAMPRPVAPGAPYMMPAAPTAMGYPRGVPPAGPHMAPNYPMNPNVMASPFASKAFIPDLNANNVPPSSAQGSGFSFMSGNGNKDSFQFVADELKGAKK